MSRPIPKLFFAGLAASGLAVAAWTGLATAQQRPKANAGQARAGQGEGDTLVLVYPTGDRATSALLVEAMTPPEVPVGQDYQYAIRVTNLTRNLTLQDVEISQMTPEGFSIESSKPEPKGGEGDHTTWSIEKLDPGQSETIQVTALGDKKGMAQACIQVDYKPTLCVMTKFTKPALSVTKAAPEEVDICRPLEIRYTVKNSGTGVAKGVTVSDELPKGLVRDESKRKVNFEAGDLQPNQSKEFTVRVNAAKTGEFASRATANAEGDLSARSAETSTRIIASELTADIQGPSAQYVNQPMTYRVNVRNDGEAVAADTKLQVDVDEDCRVVRMSKSDPQEVVPSQSGNTIAWDFGAMEPGGERTVSFTVVSGQKAELKHVARATSACAAGGDIAQANTDTAQATTEILTFPALLLEMVDETDPVRVGEEEKYYITVRNQGSGPDQNVQLKLDLPDQFEFVGVDGATNAKADGNTVTFEPIEELASKAKASWTLRLKAKKAGDVRTKVELNSEYLHSPVPEQEPTRVIE